MAAIHVHKYSYTFTSSPSLRRRRHQYQALSLVDVWKIISIMRTHTKKNIICVCIEYDKKLYFVLFGASKIIQQTHRHQSIERWAMGYECCSLINDIYFDTSLSSYAIRTSHFICEYHTIKWTRINGIHNLWIGIENRSSAKNIIERERILHQLIHTKFTSFLTITLLFLVHVLVFFSWNSLLFLHSKRQTIFGCK